MWKVKLVALLSLLVLLLSCSSSPSEPKYHVDTEAPPNPAADDARLRKLEAITVYDPDLPPGQQYPEWEIGQLSSVVSGLCYARHPCYGADPVTGADGKPHLGCADSFLRTACDLAHDTCLTETLNELAEAAVAPVPLQHVALPWHYVVPPQSEPARLAILNELRYRSQLLAFKALAVMNGYFYAVVNPYASQGLGPGADGIACTFAEGGQLVSGPGTQLYFQADGSSVAEADGRRVAQIATNALVTGERLARQSAFNAADKTVAVAEWDRGTAGSLNQAQERAFSRAQLSRSAAAHILVGGSPGLRIQTTLDANGEVPTAPAFCLAQSLSSSGQRALQAFRDTGISPDLITGNFLTTEALVGWPLASGSIADRLPFLRVGTAPNPYDEYAVSASDFQEARDYLAQEIFAFNRSRGATMSAVGPFARYAGTSTKPPRRPDAFYSAIAQQESAPPGVQPPHPVLIGASDAAAQLTDLGTIYSIGVSAPVNVGVGTEPNSLSGFYADLALWLSNTFRVYSAADPSSGIRLGTQVESDTLPASLLLQRVLNESTAVLASDYANPPCTECWRSWLLVMTKQYDSLSFVAGEDGLSCALNGNIEGGSCAGTAAVSDVFEPAPSWYASAAYSMTLSAPAGLTNPFNERGYIYGTLANGKKELIASLPALNLQPGGASAGTLRIRHAVMPEIEARVAQYLRPNADWCTHAEVECNGEKYDARVPLENELDDNSDGIENSWKYYLNRAEAAAAQADQLGQEYLSASLTAQRDEIEGQRAAVATRGQVDAEMETLQQICGLSASVDELLALFGQSGNLEQLLTGVQCTTTADCANSLQQCVGGRCIVVPTALVGSQTGATVLSRLATCLGVDTVIPQVAVGDHDVCIHSTGDPCRSDDAYCPIPVPAGKDAAAFCGNLPLYTPGTMTALTEKLGYVKVPDGVAYNDFTRLPTKTLSGDYHACRWVMPPSIQKDWFTLTEWTGWITHNPCDAQTGNSSCVAQHNCTDPPAGRTIKTDTYSFPFFDPPANDQGFGKALDITKCPDSVNIDDLDGLTPAMQMYLLKNAIQCNHSRLVTALGTRILSDVPRAVIDVLKQQGPLGRVTGLGGDFGQAIADLRQSIVARSDAMNAMQDELTGMATDLDTYQEDVQALGLRGQELTIQSDKLSVQTVMNQMRVDQFQYKEDVAAISGVIGIASSASHMDGFGMMGAVLSAGEAMGDADFERQMAELQGQIIELEKKQLAVQEAEQALEKVRHLHQTRQALQRRLTAIKGYANQIHAVLEDWNGKLYAIESLRNKASRALSRAIASSSNQLADQEKRLVHSSSNLAQLQKLRYDDAFKTAVGLSFLAKRSIETRLGRHFAEMSEKLPLLSSPPAQWENEICVASGLDYNQIANQSTSTIPQGTLNGFLGTYVNKLKNVVDAYQLQYAFREGADLMTISLKDDVFRARAICSGPSANLLKETIAPATLGPGSLGPLSATPLPPPLDRLASSNWIQPGCGSDNCVWIGETADGVGDFGVLPSTRPFLVYAKGAPMSQVVTLAAGDYVLSWYQAAGQPGSDIRLFDTTLGAPVVAVNSDDYPSHTHAGRTWSRRVRGYHFDQAGTFRVDIVPGAASATQYDWVEVGGLMLEKVTQSASYVPSEFQVSDSAGLSTLPCADKDGRAFREKYWTRDCESTCSQGATGLCTDSQRIQRCFWEASFPITVKDIENGRILRHSGFALGNYNYRIEELALNVVGSGLRDCTASSDVSCYATAYVPFSLTHTGPFTVRNHTGADDLINIFDGRIEWAKALAAERYLTNPLSNTDDSLLKQYTRQEFRGRPLDGNYVVRIWDDADFDFDKVQDVQLLLRYRYWTAAQ